MNQKERQQILIKNAFLHGKVLTLKQLAALFDCSVRTVQRRIRKCTMYKSYNQNGRYFTIDDIARFDKNGLWKYRSVYFSKFGNLRDSIVGLVHASTSGLTGNELGKLLGLSPRSFLSHFRHDPFLYREEIDGLYVYLSGDPASQKEQLLCRMKDQARLREQKKLPPPLSIIALLVELVNTPDSQPKQLKERLAAKGCYLTQEEIETVFDHYQIVQKKT